MALLGRKRAASSPDPLEAPIETELQDCIVASPIISPLSKRSARSTPVSTRATPTARKGKALAADSASGRKRAKKADEDDEGAGAAESAAKAESSARAEKASARAIPASVKRARVEPTSAQKGKGRATDTDHDDQGPIALPSASTASPRRPKPLAQKPTPTPTRSTRKSLGSSLKPLPTPPSSRKTPNGGEMRHFDEAFQDPFDLPGQGQGISRDAFLTNEALKRQREARNFRYEGDVDAPKLTRSGRVVGRTVVEDEADEYGDMGGDDEDDEMLGLDQEEEAVLDVLRPDNPLLPDIVDPTMLVQTNGHTEIDTSNPEPVPEGSDAPTPLPPGARRHILSILSTLTGASSATKPAPFADEESNEALQGLVNLLNGTVERGEGNSALVVGPRGSGKTRTIARALQLLPSTSTTSPIIVRLSGHAQTTDRLAIREMGRQIAEAEGKKMDEEVGEDEGDGEGDGNEEYAPTTLPSHLLALLTAPSPRAIVIVIEEFDLFTEHARQALLYCLLDVVQSVKTGPVESTGRGVAVIGLTSRIDTLLLLEKRVKSRFSHRVWRVISPLSPDGPGWRSLLRSVLVPAGNTASSTKTKSKANGHAKIKSKGGPEVEVEGDAETERWLMDWEFAIDQLLGNEEVARSLDRLVGLTTDVRNLYRPFASLFPCLPPRDPLLPIPPLDFLPNQELTPQIPLLSSIAYNPNESYPTFRLLRTSLAAQLALAGWGNHHAKLVGLAQPQLALLVICKHLAYAGREDFGFAQVEEEYLRFARTRLVGSGRVRWPSVVLRVAFDHLLHLGLLVPTGHSNLKPQFAKIRCTLSAHEIVAFFKGEGANLLSTELANWGRMMGGHA